MNKTVAPNGTLEGDETAYMQLTNGRYLRFAWSGQVPENKNAKGVVFYNLYTQDGNRLLSEGTVDIEREDETVFQLTQDILAFIGFREKNAAPIIYMPVTEDCFHAAVAAA